MNLLMISSDSSVAQGHHSTHYEMLRHFSRHWSRIDVICLPGPGAVPRTVHGNVHVHPSPWPKILQPLHIIRKGRALLTERNYALVTTQDYGFFYTSLGAHLLMRGRHMPLVSEIHHVEGYPIAATFRERIYRWLAMRYIPLAERHVAAFRAVNHIEVPELLRRLGVPEEKILVLPSLYMDYSTFKPDPAAEKIYDLLFVGRLAPNKGLFTLLDALDILRRERPEVRLGIRGSGRLKPALEARITALGLGANVAWIPRLVGAEDLAALYRQARALVCASTAEGGPRVTVEAMACGVPVITTPVGVMRELIHDGKNGLVFQWDAAELAQKAALLLDDDTLRARLAEAGRASVQGFAAERVIAGYAEGYHALIARQQTR